MPTRIAITSEASENVTLAQAAQDRDLQEMADRYGVISQTAGPQPLSTGKLLRRCRRKITVTPEEIKFCELYGEALNAYNRGHFGVAVERLTNLKTRDDVVTGAFENKSVQKVLEAAERLLRSPPGPEWTGVWVAEEK
jgi:hypothetical protein